MCSCEFYNRCLNNQKCFRCYNEALLKLKEEKGKSRKVYNHKEANKDNSWEDLEETIRDDLNKVPTIKEARRSRASGALWYEKSDVLDYLLNVECKERKGNNLEGGDKSISIKKSWLKKATDEALDNDRLMALPFRFKGDSDYYIIMHPVDIVELVNMIKAFANDNEIKTKEIELLKKELETLKNK